MRPDRVRVVARFGGLTHGLGHADRIFGLGDARVQQHAVGAQFHGDGHVAGRADARVDDDRIVGIVFLKVFKADSQGVRVEHALA